MDIYQLKGGKIARIPETPFKTERMLQELCEGNLPELFGLELVRSEFPIGSFRVDSIGWDAASKAFVIVEYKRNANFSVVDQGYAYLATMLANKADFVLEYHERIGKPLKKGDVDWSQSRVLFVSPSFTAFQKSAVDFKDLPIELWEIHRYENQSLAVSRIGASEQAESISKVAGSSPAIQAVSKEVKVYTEADHLSGSDAAIVELYENLKAGLLGIAGDMDFVPKKMYVAFRVGKRNIVDVSMGKRMLKLWLNLRAGVLDDPLELARDVSGVGHWGNGDYEIKLSDDSDLDYVIKLARQSYVTNTTG
jgi:predicted transport protein